jgi:hypothetical protein
VAHVAIGPVPRNTMTFVLAVPFLAVGVLLALQLSEPTWAAVTDMVDKILFNKLGSDSGVERMRWNQQAMVNFIDTDGFGAGVGSVRASSLPIAVLSNIGVIGAITYGVFICGIFVSGARRWSTPFESACQSASRWVCFTLLSCALVAGGGVDLGLQFCLFAGLACARPIRNTAGDERHQKRRDAIDVRAGSARDPRAGRISGEFPLAGQSS